MAKLRKPTSNVEKEKVKVENGKITKSKLSTEVPKMRKPQEKLRSPLRGHQSNLENFSFATTPFMRNSNLKFTSTPMNVEDNTKSNGRALGSKFVSRLALSPIFKNVCNTKQRSNEENSPEKNGKFGKDNLRKRDTEVSKVDNNVNPDIERNASLSNNSAIMGDTDSSSSRQRVLLCTMDSSNETSGSKCNSLEQGRTKTPKKHAVNENLDHGSDNTQSNYDKNNYLLKRLRSDWSSTIVDQETTNVGENAHNSTRRTKKIDDTKCVSVLELSPISKNNCNTKKNIMKNSTKNNEESEGSTHKRPIRKPEKTCTESSEKVQSTSNKRAISRPRRTSCIENSEKLKNRLSVQLNTTESSSESISSESDSDSEWRSTKKVKKQVVVKKNPKRGNSSSSPDALSQYRQDSDSSKNNHLLKRLRSDWSSTTFGEETTNVDQRSRTTSKRTENNDISREVRQNICSKLRVHLRRSTIDTKSAPEPKTNVNPKLRRKSCYDNSLANYLKSNGTHATSGDNSLTQNRTPNNNQIQRKQINKRKLTPLIEMSLEDIDISSSANRKLSDTPKVATRSRSNSNGIEEGYSSSAEFQSDDETNNRSRSKRAPTWRDLLNKSGEPPVERKKRSPVVRLQRSNLKGFEVPKNLAKNNVVKSQQKENETNPVEEESATEVPLSINMKANAVPSKEKEKDDVAFEAFKQIHDNGEQYQNAVQEVSVCEESTAASSPQQNLLGETHFGKNTSSSLLQNKNENGNDTEKYETIDLRCPVKFFHSRLENSVSQAKPQQNPKQTRSSKRKKKQESVYEFLSQSSSESNNPVDDVIQKMIKSGKAVVAKHKKGTGMNVVPRKKAKPRVVQKKKPIITEEIKQKPPKPIAEKSPVREPQQQEKHQQHDNFDNGLQFDDDFHFDDGGNEEQVRDQRGFSNLARSAMIKQAGRIQKPLQRKSITDKKKLLAMAMHFVNQSTPIRMTPQPMSAPQFSPLPGNKSPWRVTDEKLPNLFYLGRDSNNLPSFSSDYIPMTPSKNKSKSLSSFSSNDSNGENTAPPGTNTITNEANMQALTNTRKALNYRSPLKPINIIDVVNLPPLALHSYGKQSNDTSKNSSKSKEANHISINNTISKETNHSSINKTARNILGDISTHNLNNNSKNSSNQSKNNSKNSSNQSKNNSNKSLHQSKNSSNNNSHRSSNNSKIDNVFDENTVNQSQNLCNSSDDIQKNNAKDLFGFEELIDDSESNSKNVNVDKTILPNKNVLKERLERLKQLRPNTPVVIPNKNERIKPVFDNVGPQQRTLKQMLCSTMIDKNQNNHSFNDTGDMSNLFKDLEPETTFDESLPRRTYNRQFKRKRKAVSNFATFIDSDVSEDEEEVEKRPIKNYKARPNKRKKTDTEMKKFVNEFNEMCKEVGQYELIVE
ncbi:protein dalmatian [Eupeodes corollae]|uniref:protein dalmatian n=1 Tax=Eupeodes corollae TaxID=290404 RepID=UPI00248F5CA9|nr:protein dalmatian [Eupeodes corollae]